MYVIVISVLVCAHSVQDTRTQTTGTYDALSNRTSCIVSRDTPACALAFKLACEEEKGGVAKESITAVLKCAV